MCSSGVMYVDEETYLTEEEKFYNKNSENWDYYYCIPNPKAYESD